MADDDEQPRVTDAVMQVDANDVLNRLKALEQKYEALKQQIEKQNDDQDTKLENLEEVLNEAIGKVNDTIDAVENEVRGMVSDTVNKIADIVSSVSKVQGNVNGIIDNIFLSPIFLLNAIFSFIFRIFV